MATCLSATAHCLVLVENKDFASVDIEADMSLPGFIFHPHRHFLSSLITIRIFISVPSYNLSPNDKENIPRLDVSRMLN